MECKTTNPKNVLYCTLYTVQLLLFAISLSFLYFISVQNEGVELRTVETEMIPFEGMEIQHEAQLYLY